MTKYKLLKIQGELVDTVLRADDDTNFNTSIPYSSENTDYQEYLKWKEAGNTPDPADLTDWDIVREKRDRLLVASDWTMITGVTVDQAQWAAYRDKLRAIPQTFKNVSDPLTEITWPTAPSTKGPNTT